MRLKSSRRQDLLVGISLSSIPFILFAICLYFSYRNSNLYLFLLLLSILFMAIIVSYIYRKQISKQIFKLYVQYLVDVGLMSIKAYEDAGNGYAITPKVKITDNEVIIKALNPHIMKILVDYQENLSLLLPKDWIAIESYKSRDEKDFIIKYRDLMSYERIRFNNPSEFITAVRRIKPNEFLFDTDKNINLMENPHLLITGASGSGKTYFAQLLIYQALLKRFEVIILDYKRSYQAFSSLAKVSYSIEDIEETLKKVINELHKRQVEMDEYLKNDPQAVATDYGYQHILVVFEEYLAVVNSNADKNTLKRIESMVLEITTTGRSLGISIVMILQQASATTLNSSIRSNLGFKIAFGNCSQSILETTFGKSDLPKISSKMNKGEGFYQEDAKISRCCVPTINFKVNELLYVISLINNEFKYVSPEPMGACPSGRANRANLKGGVDE